MAKRGRRAGREGEMRAVLESWVRSGLPLAQFARREGIAEKTMYRWRQRLGVGDRHLRRGRPPVGEVPPPSMFTEVSKLARRGTSATMMFEVVLSDGTTVRVPEHFDPETLRILVTMLRGC